MNSYIPPRMTTLLNAIKYLKILRKISKNLEESKSVIRNIDSVIENLEEMKNDFFIIVNQGSE